MVKWHIVKLDACNSIFIVQLYVYILLKYTHGQKLSTNGLFTGWKFKALVLPMAETLYTELSIEVLAIFGIFEKFYLMQ